MSKPYEQTFQVIFTRLLDLAWLNMNVIDEKLFLVDKALEIPAQRYDIIHQFLSALLKGNKHPWFFILLRSAHQKLHGKQGLTTTGAAAHQGGTSFWQSSVCNFIKSLYPGWTFWKR